MTTIEWTRGDDGSMGKTWNPVAGCTRVSPGCDNCYAMRFAHRFSGPGGRYEGLTRIGKRGVDWSGAVRLVPTQLDMPLRWRKPRRIFVNSMSDLFHQGLSNEEIAAVFGVMAACQRHTFQVLTKRPERAVKWFRWLDAQAGEHDPSGATQCGIHAANYGADVDYLGLQDTWPLPNVWLGVSAENQEAADERIPLLLECPAAVRFVSAEPLLGPISLERYMWPTCWHWASPYNTPEEARAAGAYAEKRRQALVSAHTRFVDWVIVGGESGNGARPFHTDWAQSIADQCKAAGVACFVKQLGAHVIQGGERRRKADPKGGDWSEWPESLRVREFPRPSETEAPGGRVEAE